MDTTEIETAFAAVQTAVNTALAAVTSDAPRVFDMGDYRAFVSETGAIVKIEHR